MTDKELDWPALMGLPKKERKFAQQVFDAVRDFIPFKSARDADCVRKAVYNQVHRLLSAETKTEPGYKVFGVQDGALILHLLLEPIARIPSFVEVDNHVRTTMIRDSLSLAVLTDMKDQPLYLYYIGPILGEISKSDIIRVSLRSEDSDGKPPVKHLDEIAGVPCRHLYEG